MRNGGETAIITPPDRTRGGGDSFHRRTAAQTLLFRLLFFGLQPAAFAAQRRLGGLAAFGRILDLTQHIDQFLAAVLDVADLVSMAIAADDEFALDVDAVSEPLQESLLPLAAQQRLIANLPAQGRFGIDFVDVLAAWTAAARKRYL